MREKSFIYYASWEDAISDMQMDESEELEYRRAIAAYGLRGEETATSRYVRGCMALVKREIDITRSNREAYVEQRRINGAKGGRPKKQNNQEVINENQKNHMVLNETKKTLDIDKDIDIDKDKELLPPTPYKKTFGEYHHVLLTEKEYNGLIERWGGDMVAGLISILDEYMEQTGKTYKNCYIPLHHGWVVDRYKETNMATAAKSERKEHNERIQEEINERKRNAVRGIDLEDMNRMGIKKISEYLKVTQKA